MKAAVLYGDNDIRIESLKKPIPEINEALIEVKVTGICGSDLPRVLNDGAHFYPIVLGHEFSGVVEAVADNEYGIKIGDKVACAPLLPCHNCRECLTGNHSLCKNYSFIGSRSPGSWAEYVKAPIRNLVKLTDKVSFIEGALIEPITVVLHALNNINFSKNPSVAIIGMGTIGMLALQCVKNLGVNDIAVFDIDDKKLANAKNHGADGIFNPMSGNFKSDLDVYNGEKGFEIVIDAVGSSLTINLSLILASGKSQVMFIGTPTSKVEISHKDFELINRKELIIQGSWMSYSAPYPGNEWTTAVRYLEKGVIDSRSIINQAVPFENIGEIFNEIKTSGNMNRKIILEL
ncbi:MAG: galactitol-1-phosphate 5-dehydrogenase [Deltaproteobacteria bacterium]|jgi:L-iditol 2-dehydrogenase|nr:galactitol-1-phosphate 5-dehydrogenase [Deltaproteobacteria bacterium]MBT4525979.1 galactitol-1-phosphate 5-dehydrogenase [Deltaproteobacteria bacterium]